jgi:hypothetical protein
MNNVYDQWCAACNVSVSFRALLITAKHLRELMSVRVCIHETTQERVNRSSLNLKQEVLLKSQIWLCQLPIMNTT